ncbi:hypothetical protein ACFIOY_01545 [Bradyrhizobium sp. TZ2]
MVFHRRHFWRAGTLRELGLLNDAVDPVVIKSRMEVLGLLFLQYDINPAATDSWPRLALALASAHALPFNFSVELHAKKRYAENLVRAVEEICRSVGS